VRLSDAQERKLLWAAWSRRLALLLDLGLPLLQALEIAGQSVGDLAEVMLPLCTRVRVGETLSEAMSDQPEEFTLFMRAVVLAGEHGGQLPRSLRGLAECLEAERFVEVRPAIKDLCLGVEEPPAIRLTRELMAQATREDAAEIQIAPLEQTLGVKFKLHGRWAPRDPIEATDPEAVIRRLLMMAGIPYWIKEPAVGTMRLWIEQRRYEVGVRAFPAADEGWETLEMSLRPMSPENGEDEWA
jgi:type II secretory ATPase GspE/PulE/Tfp pilus assembly ATPase PilB-like protein